MRLTKRTEDLIVTIAGNDALVYDERSKQLHVLPATVAAVWDACSGQLSLEQIATTTGQSRAEVDAALQQLASADLLHGPAVTDRRKLLRSAGVAAAIVTVAAPAAVAASSHGSSSSGGSADRMRYNSETGGMEFEEPEG